MCVTCGTQFPPGSRPSGCPICEDERQYVGSGGQAWTSIAELTAAGRRNELRELEPGLVGIGTQPPFAIGQRALLVVQPEGNVLWDAISVVDEQSIAAVDALGGIAVIAVSHPHYHASMVSWSRAFGGAPIYLHELVRPWVMREDANIRYWSGPSLPLDEGLSLHNIGGHFSGFQVLHWRGGAEGRGALLAGDQPQVAADRRWVSFMYSYPNYIPLAPAEVRRIVEVLEPLAFDRIYRAWWDRVLTAGAKGALHRSAERYLRALAGLHGRRRAAV
ncbi:MAG: hypothetical protein JW820_11905 [Spirochaetales bacterium]|nr:hypothetical protein [Spirochaetales bacterium]